VLFNLVADLQVVVSSVEKSIILQNHNAKIMILFEQNCKNTTEQYKVKDRRYNTEINNKIKLHILGVWQKYR